MKEKTYASRSAGWHLKCCQDYWVTVQRDSDSWWRATARSGVITYHTGGRTRRHAETNALDGVNAPLQQPNAGLFAWPPYDGPS